MPSITLQRPCFFPTLQNAFWSCPPTPHSMLKERRGSGPRRLESPLNTEWGVGGPPARLALCHIFKRKKYDIFHWFFSRSVRAPPRLTSTIVSQLNTEWGVGGPPARRTLYHIFKRKNVTFFIGFLNHFSRSVRAPHRLTSTIFSQHVLASNNTRPRSRIKFCFSVCLHSTHTRSLGGGWSEDSTRSLKRGVSE